MVQPCTQTQRAILNGLLGIIQGHVISAESNAERMDQYLSLVSNLPAVRAILGEEDCEGDGTRNEVYLTPWRAQGSC